MIMSPFSGMEGTPRLRNRRREYTHLTVSPQGPFATGPFVFQGQGRYPSASHLATSGAVRRTKKHAHVLFLTAVHALAFAASR